MFIAALVSRSRDKPQWGQKCQRTDPSEHVGEPRLGIDVVELRRLDQRVHHRRALASGIGTTEGPIPATDGNATNGALGGIA